MTDRLRESEDDFTTFVLELAKTYRWNWYHPHDSRRQVGTDTDGQPILVGDVDARDWPDYTFWRDRIVFAELKGTTGKLTPGQKRCLQQLRAAGGEAYVWWPKDRHLVRAVLAMPPARRIEALDDPVEQVRVKGGRL